jgi:hypothetical protein
MTCYDSFSKNFSDSRKDMKWPEIDYIITFIKKQAIYKNKIKQGLKIKILDI